MALELLHLGVGQDNKLLISGRILDGNTCIDEKLAQLHGAINCMASNTKIQVICEERIKLDTRQSSFRQQGTMPFHDIEEVVWCITSGKHNSLTAESTYFGATNVEHIAMMGKPREVKVAFGRHQSISKTCAIDEERYVVLLTDGMNLLYLFGLIKSAQFRRKCDIYHTWKDHVVARRIGMESLKIVAKFICIHLALMGGKSDDFMSISLNGT